MKVNWSDNFEELYKQRGQQKYGIRLLALWKIQSGMTMTEVCGLLKKTHRSVYKWRKLYEEGGLDALLSMRAGRGRKSRLVDAELLTQEITALTKQQNGGRIRCQDVVDRLAEKYNISYSQPGMYHVLHRLGFSWITGRSKHPKSNPETQEDFKKTL